MKGDKPKRVELSCGPCDDCIAVNRTAFYAAVERKNRGVSTFAVPVGSVDLSPLVDIYPGERRPRSRLIGTNEKPPGTAKTPTGHQARGRNCKEGFRACSLVVCYPPALDTAYAGDENVRGLVRAFLSSWDA